MSRGSSKSSLSARRRKDNSLQRLDLIDVVEEAGFEVVTAWSADETISILEKRADIRVVFTDIDMPGSMDGLRFAPSIRYRWPPIEIIVTSGGVTPNIASLPSRTIFIPQRILAPDAIRALRLLAA